MFSNICITIELLWLCMCNINPPLQELSGYKSTLGAALLLPRDPPSVCRDTSDHLLPIGTNLPLSMSLVSISVYNPLNLCSVMAAWKQQAGKAQALAKTETREVWVKTETAHKHTA